MYKSLVFIVIAVLLPMTFVFANASYTEFMYDYSYATGKISGQTVTKEGNGYKSRAVIVEGVVGDKLVYANCEYMVVNTQPRDLITVNFKRSNPRVSPDCVLDILNKIDDTQTNTDMDDLKARAYCMAALGPKYVPHLKYTINKDGKPELDSATCIPNTIKIGPTEDKQLVCKDGIKEIDLAGSSKCRACIEKFDEINLRTPIDSNGNPVQQPQTPGVQCTPLTITPGQYIPTTNPNDYVGVTNSSDNNQSGSTGGSNNTGTGGGGSQQQPPPPQYRPPSGPQGVQYLPPQQPQLQRQSLWQSIKQSLGGGGGRPPGGQDPRKVMPECPVFLALDTEIERGQSTVLQWSLEYTSSAYITPGIGLVNPTEGSIKISPEETTTYTIQTHNRNGYGKCAPVQVTVTEPADVDPGDGDQTEDTPKDPLMECSPSKVRTGGTGAVLWQCPSGVASSTGGSTEYPAFTTSGKIGGSVEVSNMQESGKFVVRCMSDAGEEIGRNSCDIEVADSIYDGTPADDGQPRVNIAADKTEVNAGDIVTIAWRGDNVDGCMVSGPDGFKKYGTRGSITGRMLQTSTFALSCVADNVILPTKEITITVN